MQSTAGAARSSLTRTAPRSPRETSAGSLIEPDSPRDAHMSTMRAPASAARASVPPQASDSSSGCAKTARIVRPASESAVGTMRLDHTAVDGLVLLGHPFRAETRERLLAHLLPVQLEQPRHPLGH